MIANFNIKPFEYCHPSYYNQVAKFLPPLIDKKSSLSLDGRGLG